MWEISNKGQIINLLYSLSLGGIFCIIYDFIRAFRLVFRSKTIVYFITDVLFFALCGILTFLLLLALTGGEIRGYVILGILLGFILIRLIISKITLLLFKKFAKATLFLLSLFAKINRRICEKIIKATKKISLLLRSLRKKLLKTGDSVLYNRKKCEKKGEKANGN